MLRNGNKFRGEKVYMGYCLNYAEYTYESKRRRIIIRRSKRNNTEEHQSEEYRKRRMRKKYQENPWYADGYDSY